MITRHNCIHYTYTGHCAHPLAPRGFFGGCPACLLDKRSTDPREVIGCAKQVPSLRPLSHEPPRCCSKLRRAQQDLDK